MKCWSQRFLPCSSWSETVRMMSQKESSLSSISTTILRNEVHLPTAPATRCRTQSTWRCVSCPNWSAWCCQRYSASNRASSRIRATKKTVHAYSATRKSGSRSPTVSRCLSKASTLKRNKQNASRPTASLSQQHSATSSTSTKALWCYWGRKYANHWTSWTRWAMYRTRRETLFRRGAIRGRKRARVKRAKEESQKTWKPRRQMERVLSATQTSMHRPIQAINFRCQVMSSCRLMASSIRKLESKASSPKSCRSQTWRLMSNSKEMAARVDWAGKWPDLWPTLAAKMLYQKSRRKRKRACQVVMGAHQAKTSLKTSSRKCWNKYLMSCCQIEKRSPW